MDNKELWTKYKSHCHNKGLTQNRINKLHTMFNMVSRGIQRPLSEATEQDIRSFVNRLHKGEFRTQRGNKEYSGSSKADAKKFLKQFYKWLEGEGERYPDKVRWIRTSIAKDEKPEEKDTVTIKQTHKIAQQLRKPEDRILIYLLFDSGFRAQEILSAKKKDLTRKEYTEDGEKCWWIKCNKSKTIHRTVPVPLFTSEINQFVQTGYYKSLEPEQKLIQKGYRAMLNAIKRASEKAINKKLTTHSFRHSSATYYAQELGDHYALCDRYGWDYTSNTPKTYIRKSGVRQKKTAQKVVNNQISKTNKRVSELEKENQDLKNKINKMEKVLDSVVKKIKRN